MQKRLGGNSTARRRHLSGLSGSKARPALESLIGKPPPPADPATPATRTTDAEVDAALARTALAGIVSQVEPPPPLETLSLCSASPLVLARTICSN